MAKLILVFVAICATTRASTIPTTNANGTSLSAFLTNLKEGLENSVQIPVYSSERYGGEYKNYEIKLLSRFRDFCPVNPDEHMLRLFRTNYFKQDDQ